MYQFKIIRQVGHLTDITKRKYQFKALDIFLSGFNYMLTAENQYISVEPNLDDYSISFLEQISIKLTQEISSLCNLSLGEFRKSVSFSIKTPKIYHINEQNFMPIWIEPYHSFSVLFWISLTSMKPDMKFFNVNDEVRKDDFSLSICTSKEIPILKLNKLIDNENIDFINSINNALQKEVEFHISKEEYYANQKKALNIDAESMNLPDVEIHFIFKKAYNKEQKEILKNIVQSFIKSNHESTTSIYKIHYISDFTEISPKVLKINIDFGNSDPTILQDLINAIPIKELNLSTLKIG